MYARITRKAQLRGQLNSLYFEYNVWDSLEAMNAGVAPDTESHVIQRNWTGQQVVTRADGWMRTATGIWIDPATLDPLTEGRYRWEYEAASIDIGQEVKALIEGNLRSLATRNVAPRLARNIPFEDTQLGRLANLAEFAIPEQRPQRPRLPGSATLDLQVGANADDAATSGGAGGWGLNNNAAWSYSSPYVMEGGWRFLAATIAVGSTINNSYLTWTVAIRNAGTDAVTIRGDDEDDAATFTTYANFAGRTRTTASYSYTVPSNPTLDAAYSTPANSLDALIQEIIDRAGWASGNDLALFSYDAQNTITSYWYDYNQSTAKAMKLHIEYTAGGAAAFIPRVMIF